ncbi:MAG: hypothetical protein HY908_10325 [Myxococcales bacterium]|nr:hypothetical protein [Myxococcales bacterium]
MAAPANKSPLRLAEEDGKPVVVGWLAAALRALAAPDDALTAAALATNFAWERASPDARAHGLARIAEVYRAVRGIVLGSHKHFAATTRPACEALFRTRDIPPAYAIYGDRVYFTPAFAPFDPATGRGFGPLCRAAMVLHEAVHLVDPRSGEEAVHVSEWDEPRFSSLDPAAQLSNPSAYASFAAQVHERALVWPREARFGAGNPAR